MRAETPCVAIVGAGLGGLCLAQGLRRRGIRFEVFERDAAFDSRSQGYRLRIDHDGQQALRACLPEALYALFRASSALPARGVNVFDPALRNAGDRWVDSWRQADDDAAEDLNVHRLSLRELLMSGIEAQVHFGKACRGYEQRADGSLSVRFEDGDSREADVLVAADGVHSTLRRQLLPTHAPADSGAVCLYARTLPTPELLAALDARLLEHTSIVFGDGIASIIDAMRFRDRPECDPATGTRLSPVDDYLYWALIGSRRCFGLVAEQALELAPEVLAARVEQATQDWAPGLRSLYRHASAADMALLAVRHAAPLAAWPGGRVTVLGDAVHVMSPAGGLGANTALRDAAQLAACLDGSGADPLELSSRIGAYEAAMRDYATAAVEASARGARLLAGESLAV